MYKEEKEAIYGPRVLDSSKNKAEKNFCKIDLQSLVKRPFSIR